MLILYQPQLSGLADLQLLILQQLNLRPIVANSQDCIEDD